MYIFLISFFQYLASLLIIFLIFLSDLYYQQNLKHNQAFNLFYSRFLVDRLSISLRVYFRMQLIYFKKGNRTMFLFIDSYNFCQEFPIFLNVLSLVHQLPCFLFLPVRLYSLSHPNKQILQLG